MQRATAASWVTSSTRTPRISMNDDGNNDA
jgi:hypothetical protein